LYLDLYINGKIKSLRKIFFQKIYSIQNKTYEKLIMHDLVFNKYASFFSVQCALAFMNV